MTTLLSALSSIENVRVLCIGDIILDKFIYGDVERISPEAPIPVLKISRETQMLGGAGNVVRNVTSLGAKAVFMGITGQDEAATTLKTLLEETDGCSAHMLQENDRITPLKTRFMAAQQQMLRTDHETVEDIKTSDVSRFMEQVSEQITTCDVVVLSDYGKGVLTREVCQKIIHLALLNNLKVIVDPKGSDYTKYKGASLVTPNRKELQEASGISCLDEATIITAAQKLITDCKIDRVLATRSQDGMSLISKEETPFHLPTEAREVFDVSGAGDTVVATMAVALGAQHSFEIAAELANRAAGLVVAKSGTATVSHSELSDHLHHLDRQGHEIKIVSRETAQSQIENWRKKGQSIGFTNGCFDLLHPGHLSLLDQSKGQCDRLIVGLNSDASIKRLKGEERPIQNEDARALVLASLANVDLVVVFEEDTPLSLLECLVPDVLVKGADYTIDQVVGADLIQSNGGRVYLAELQEGFSTTNTVRKIKTTS